MISSLIGIGMNIELSPQQTPHVLTLLVLFARYDSHLTCAAPLFVNPQSRDIVHVCSHLTHHVECGIVAIVPQPPPQSLPESHTIPRYHGVMIVASPYHDLNSHVQCRH